MSGMLFKAVVQEVLIFESETWVTTPHMGQALGGFHKRVARRITERHPQSLLDRCWEYPQLEAEMQEAGF